MSTTVVYSTTQSRTIALLPMITGSLSAYCSILIMRIILSDVRKATRHCFRERFGLRMYDRIMFGISLLDVINSIHLAFSFILVPKGTDFAFFAHGNKTTCKISAFMTQFGLSVLFYNASLSMYFLLVISGVSVTTLNKIEILFHGFPVLLGTVLAIMGLVLDVYHPHYGARACWIHASPPDCKQIEEIECTRGANADDMKWLIAGIWILFVFIFMVAVNSMISYKFRKIARKSGEADSIRAVGRSRFVTITARFYLLAYLLNVIFVYIQHVVRVLTGRRSFAVEVLIEIFYPSQGVFNYLVFKWRRSLTYYIVFVEWLNEEPSSSVVNTSSTDMKQPV